MVNKKKSGSSIQGVARLITEATLGITDLVEAMHRRVVHPPLLPSTPIQHLITQIASITYKNIKWSTKFIGNGLDKGLAQLTPLLENIKTTKKKEAIQAALNGVVGDYLEEKENPLKIAMQFRIEGKAIPLDTESIELVYPSVNGNILLMVHGSCMNDIQWAQNEHNHGEQLAKELHKTPIYLHYNSGLHISTNGQELNDMLEELLEQWPVPVEELIVVAHSMGGLVTRSAVYYGQQQSKKWTKYLKKVVLMGTPHHGAPLERAGNYLDVILETIPYTKPFARLGKIRSAGVTDLRFGYLVDKDWQDSDRFELQKDKKQIIPLPQNIAFYTIAASVSKKSNAVASKSIGDRLVPINSALGKHNDPDKCLQFKAQNTYVAYESTHIDLLGSKKVYAKMKNWLAS